MSMFESGKGITWEEFNEYKAWLKAAKEKEEMATNMYDNFGPIDREMNKIDYKTPGQFDIEKAIFNGPATIIRWKDGTKTVVKCENEVFDTEKGIAMAITKKALGNNGNYYNTIRKALDESEIYNFPEKSKVNYFTEAVIAAMAAFGIKNKMEEKSDE